MKTTNTESGKGKMGLSTALPVRVRAPVLFLLDSPQFIVYSLHMLTGIRIFTADPYWRQVISDLNAVVVDDAHLADIDLDSLELNTPAVPMELKSAIISALDDSKVLLSIFGRTVSLSPIQRRIVVCLGKSGGMTAEELKLALGYARDTTTHTVDTAIYGLRKLFGRDFIVNENGIFKIGGV